MYELMDFIKINKVIILLTIGERNGFHLLFICSSSIAYETGYYCVALIHAQPTLFSVREFV